MDIDRMLELLNDVKSGKTDVDTAVDMLRELPYKDLGFAKVDNHREIRVGYPEIIYGRGKTAEQICGIIKYMDEKGSNILATRCGPEVYEEVIKISAQAKYNEAARTISIIKKEIKPTESTVAVITAGTSDIPVAEEAAETLSIFGNKVDRIYDTGVAGIHRLLGSMDRIRSARVVIVVAGMEGALASVVGGLVDKPVIAVPVSTGYGASFHGLSALLAMLNSCAGGVTVVNIDNGFGAGYAAGMINKL